MNRINTIKLEVILADIKVRNDARLRFGFKAGMRTVLFLPYGKSVI